MSEAPVPEMVDRVARAMCIAAMVDPDWCEDPDGLPQWRNRVALAKVAIQAMRRPTQQMRHACWDLMEANAKVGNCEAGRIRGSAFPDVILDRMIDAALSTEAPDA